MILSPSFRERRLPCCLFTSIRSASATNNTTDLNLSPDLLAIKMGLFGFGGSSSGDTSGQTSSSSGLDLSGYSSGSSDAYSSKMRSPSSSDYDFSSSSSSFDSMSSTSGDIQATIQAEQQKMQLMSAVSEGSFTLCDVIRHI